MQMHGVPQFVRPGPDQHDIQGLEPIIYLGQGCLDIGCGYQLAWLRMNHTQDYPICISPRKRKRIDSFGPFELISRLRSTTLTFFAMNATLFLFNASTIHTSQPRKNQPIRLPGLSLDLARDGELAEPKLGVCSGLILSGAFYPDLKIGVWRRRTYQADLPET
jgi:hypothetical protein